MASSELGSYVDASLLVASIDTAEEVHNYRVPGERRNNAKSPTAGEMATTLGQIEATLGKYFISRKRIRHDALCLLKEGAL